MPVIRLDSPLRALFAELSCLSVGNNASLIPLQETITHEPR